MLHSEILVLDHGYVKYITHMGSDESVIEAARMSTQKGFEQWEDHPCSRCGYPISNEAHHDCCPDGEKHKRKPGDVKLLKYLWDHQHTTPFEMGSLIIEVQAPIMVFREWHRHRTQSYNEASARYSPLPDINYLPTVERCMRNAGKNKQAAAVDGSIPLVPEAARDWLQALSAAYDACERTYQIGLSIGIPKELARLILPVGRYSKMRASANLLNWLKFLKLRYSGDAQYEIMAFASGVKQILTERFPRVMQLVNLPEVQL